MPTSKIFLVAFQPVEIKADSEAAESTASGGTRADDCAALEQAIRADGGIRVRGGEFLALSTELPDIAAASAHFRGLPRSHGRAGTIADQRGDRLIVEEVTQRGNIAVHAEEPQSVLAWLSEHLPANA